MADRQGIDFTDHGRLSIAAIRDLGLPRDGGRLSLRTVGVHGLSSAPASSTYGLDPARVHTEIFGAAPALTPGIAATSIPAHLPVGPPGPGPEVQFARSGVSAPWGPPSTRACSNSPKRATSRPGGPAAPGFVTTARPRCCPGTVRYDPEPLEPPARGKHPDLLLATRRGRGGRPLTATPVPTDRAPPPR